jgi:uncharacterized protein (DUF2147 family)
MRADSLSSFFFVRSAVAVFAFATILGPLHPSHRRAGQSPVGMWSTISDDDGRPTAIVEIREVRGELVGVVRALLVPASHEDSVCGKCSGDRKGQRVVGMEILRHLRPNGREWSGGEILDPENGRTYKATLQLEGDGRKLVVRGYIGFSMFGRSQTWVRCTARTSALCGDQSARSASTGSILTARRAGRYDASTATPATPSAMTTNVTGSLGVTA